MVMRRAIKGTSSEKGKRGDIVELSFDEKTNLALKDALANPSGWGDEWKGCLAYATEISIEKTDGSSKGNPLKGMWLNNNYKARGTFKLNRRSKNADEILEGRKHNFVIAFHDCLDQEGIPDLKVVEFKITRI